MKRMPTPVATSHLSGRFIPSITPEACGPRKDGQLAFSAPARKCGWIAIRTSNPRSRREFILRRKCRAMGVMGESRERCRYAGEGRLSRAHVSAPRSDAMKSTARSADPSSPTRRIKPHTRRDFLIQSAALAGAALAGNPLADAAGGCGWRTPRRMRRGRAGGSRWSIPSAGSSRTRIISGGRFMEGYEREGFHHQPSQAVVRMFNPKSGDGGKGMGARE